jgi:hypothetical protein
MTPSVKEGLNRIAYKFKLLKNCSIKYSYAKEPQVDLISVLLYVFFQKLNITCASGLKGD